MKLLLLALSLSLSFACGGSSTPPPAAPAPAPAAPAAAADPVAPAAAPPAASSPSDDEVGAAAIAMMQAMAQGAKDNEGDCDAQADALQAVIDDNADLMAVMKEHDRDPARREAFEARYQEQAMEIMDGLMGSLMPCGENLKLRQVFEQFE